MTRDIVHLGLDQSIAIGRVIARYARYWNRSAVTAAVPCLLFSIKCVLAYVSVQSLGMTLTVADKHQRVWKQRVRRRCPTVPKEWRRPMTSILNRMARNVWRTTTMMGCKSALRREKTHQLDF
ncbi:hypothetical protein WCN78_17870 [Xanthomonas axonopodis pv. vasculorum]